MEMKQKKHGRGEWLRKELFVKDIKTTTIPLRSTSPYHYIHTLYMNLTHSKGPIPSFVCISSHRVRLCAYMHTTQPFRRQGALVPLTRSTHKDSWINFRDVLRLLIIAPYICQCLYLQCTVYGNTVELWDQNCPLHIIQRVNSTLEWMSHFFGEGACFAHI